MSLRPPHTGNIASTLLRLQIIPVTHEPVACCIAWQLLAVQGLHSLYAPARRMARRKEGRKARPEGQADCPPHHPDATSAPQCPPWLASPSCRLASCRWTRCLEEPDEGGRGRQGQRGGGWWVLELRQEWVQSESMQLSPLLLLLRW